MDEKEYLVSRVDDQIKWFDRKSVLNKKWHYLQSIISAFASIMIPFLISYFSYTAFRDFVIFVLGIVAAISIAIEKIFKFRSNWTRYRGTCETLKREKFLYLTKAPPYDSRDFGYFVERIENILQEENKSWKSTVQEKNQDATGS